MAPTMKSLDHLVLTVTDIAATVAFYTDVLGMTAEVFQGADGVNRHALKFGPQKINLHLKGHEFEPKALAPTTGSGDLCFLTDTDLTTWVHHLEQRSVAVVEGPVARTGANGPITSIYVVDPDGNLIEISVQD